ncbi:MAG: CRISPR-associated endonuclease Cas2 [Gammaproteobacteria bacterium]
MWIVVFFDLPTNTNVERKRASNFRLSLLKNGFSMFQYSVYMRPCPSPESMTVHKNRISHMIPAAGHVSVVSLTDKQYGLIENFIGLLPAKMAAAPNQLEML